MGAQKGSSPEAPAHSHPSAVFAFNFLFLTREDYTNYLDVDYVEIIS